MPQLLLHNREIKTVFELLGDRENDITYSVGWALYRCPCFLREFLRETIGFTGVVGDVSVRLQKLDPRNALLRSREAPPSSVSDLEEIGAGPAQAHGGFTDIELESPGKFHVIVEAKRGWNLPGGEQLEKYAPRLAVSAAPQQKLVVLSECSREYAFHHLECREVQGVGITPVSWKELASVAAKSCANGSNSEKRLLEELRSYLGRIMTMQKIDSNWVYVVPLANGTPGGWSISWIDIVRERRRYFHPVGNRRPVDPPNYIAFRFYGKLQSIHHIESYEIFTKAHEHFPEIPDQEWDPHYLYILGPAFAPAHEVPTGNLYGPGQHWCMLDTLFTCSSVSEARDLSNARAEAAH
jgi:hypothetical protein